MSDLLNLVQRLTPRGISTGDFIFRHRGGGGGGGGGSPDAMESILMTDKYSHDVNILEVSTGSTVQPNVNQTVF